MSNDLPKHGGDLVWASEKFGIAPDDWLDLSTGISPWAWPVGEWPEKVFRSLPPQSLAMLQQTAGDYYGCLKQSLLPVPGSQYAISAIPTKLQASTVAVPALGYQEHRHAWQKAGHSVLGYDDFDQLCEWVSEGRAANVILINPNNPSGERIARDKVIKLQQSLLQATSAKGLLVIDEAFMDMDPASSLASEPLANTVILRSFGKFFGLAGVRLGFVIDHSRQYLRLMDDQAGPWLISHPAVWVAQQALQDAPWAEAQRLRIRESSAQLYQLLDEHFCPLEPATGRCNGGLFVTTCGPTALLYQHFTQLAEQGILVRYSELTEQEAWLRIGLSDSYQRLRVALHNIARNHSAS